MNFSSDIISNIIDFFTMEDCISFVKYIPHSLLTPAMRKMLCTKIKNNNRYLQYFPQRDILAILNKAPAYIKYVPENQQTFDMARVVLSKNINIHGVHSEFAKVIRQQLLLQNPKIIIQLKTQTKEECDIVLKQNPQLANRIAYPSEETLYQSLKRKDKQMCKDNKLFVQVRVHKFKETLREIHKDWAHEALFSFLNYHYDDAQLFINNIHIYRYVYKRYPVLTNVHLSRAILKNADLFVPECQTFALCVEVCHHNKMLHNCIASKLLQIKIKKVLDSF